jgi:hypothetical protein
MEQEGFFTDLYTTMLFFRFCRRYNVREREARLNVMRELVKRKKAKYLRDVAPWLAGKKVLVIRPKPPHNPWDEHYCPDCGPRLKKENR